MQTHYTFRGGKNTRQRGKRDFQLVKLSQNRRGNLVISVPRAGRTWLLLASATVTIGYGAFAWFAAFPRWFSTLATLVVGCAAMLFVWRVMPDRTVEFNVRKGVVLRDGKRVAGIEQVECVEIAPGGEEAPRSRPPA